MMRSNIFERTELERARKTVEEKHLSDPNVVAVGIGYRHVGGKRTDEVVVIVGVRKKLSLDQLKPEQVIPPTVDGTRTDVIEFGDIKALAIAADDVPLTLSQRRRPCPGGFSIGHPQISAGTLGVWVKRQVDPRWYVLSNNHVLANSNDASVGDPILQPGPYDGGAAADRIGSLADFVPINFSGLNYVDAALALVDSSADVEPIVDRIGGIKGTRDLGLGMEVRKSGRTTEYTTGHVTAVRVTVDVDYGGPIARFVEQVVIEPGGFSAGGDSGSLIVGPDNMAGGLLFAGGPGHTIASPISAVVEALKVVFPMTDDVPPVPPPAPPEPPKKNSLLCRWLAAFRIANRRLARR